MQAPVIKKRKKEAEKERVRQSGRGKSLSFKLINFNSQECDLRRLVLKFLTMTTRWRAREFDALDNAASLTSRFEEGWAEQEVSQTRLLCLLQGLGQLFDFQA